MAQTNRGNAVDRQAIAHTCGRYDRMAPLYDTMEGFIEAAQYRTWRTMLWSQVRGPRVLELGVGTGKNIPHYPADVTVSAIDISSRMMAQAVSLAANIHAQRPI